MEETGEYLFYREDEPAGQRVRLEPWKVLIVDDDEEVHRTTKVALMDFLFEGRELNILSSYSGQSARELIIGNPDIAVILLDVVMESDTSGLDLVRYIREVICNRLVRIILRTGQPGIAPEKSVIIDYDINDFKDKSDLTIQKLYTSIITCLRSYKDLRELEHANSALKEEFEKRITAEREVAEKEQQASIGLSIAQVIHGAKNILNAIKGGKYMVTTGLAKNNMGLLKEGWDIVEKGLIRMENLSHDLLSLSRFSRLDLKLGSINKLAQEIVSIYQDENSARYNSDVKVMSEFEPHIPDIIFDNEAMHTAIMNLVSNAVDACSDMPDRKHLVVLRTLSDTANNGVIVEIEDNGCGIRPEEMDKICKMFYSTKFSKGTGLGLPITKKIIEEHSGSLEVSSEAGVKTIFRVKIPMSMS